MTESLLFIISLLFFLSYFYYKLSTAWAQNLFLLILSCAFIVSYSSDHGILLSLSFFVTFFGLKYSDIKYVPHICVLGLFAVLISTKLTLGASPLHHLSLLEKAAIPLGLSFFVFQLSSLIIDRTRNKVNEKIGLVELALFSTYIPQLAAGPIESAKTLLPQLHYVREFSYQELKKGLIEVFQGLVKKVIFANLIFSYLIGFRELKNVSIFDFVMLAIFTRYYIYFSFSAYINMALGVSKFFGIKLSENFKNPLNSKTLTEFWTKWHITLGLWVKNYVFFPLALQAQRKSYPLALATMTSFIFIGLWHEISLAFLCYGLIQGIVVSLEHKLKIVDVSWTGIKRYFNYLYRYLVIFVPSLLFFFSLEDLIDTFNLTTSIYQKETLMPQAKIVFAILIYEYFKSFNSKFNFTHKVLHHKQAFLRWTLYLLAIIFVFIFGTFDEDAMFLYFNL